MQRFQAVGRWVALAAILCGLIYLPACGGKGGGAATKVASIVITPTSLSLNEGDVGRLSAVAENSSGAGIAADITFTSTNPAIATVSTGGLVCAGVWDTSFINCTPTIGQGGVGQIQITASSGGVSAMVTVFVHEKVDQVQAVAPTACVSAGQPITMSGMAFNITDPGCSPSAPCDITSTVGPFTFGSNDFRVAASSAGIQAAFNSSDHTPTYVSGGTITGSKGQTCDLSMFNTIFNATATVALTGANTIAGGTQLTITNPGFGGSIAPTTAILGNGTATCSGTAIVKTDLSSGVLTAQGPGAATVYASVSGVNSVGVPYETCRVVSISVHDLNGTNTSFTLNPQGTQTLAADVVDSAGVAISTPALSWGSSSQAVASVPALTNLVRAATVTAVTGGTAYVTASCSFPNCNINVPANYSVNVATFNITTPSQTTVYAASTNSTSLVPISTSTNTAGTPITLPQVPNSIIADPRGANVYLGSSAGIMRVTVSSGAITVLGVNGTILAISPDGQYVLVSDPTGNMVNYVNVVTATLSGSTMGTATASAYTPDSKFNEWVNGTKLGFGLQTGFINSGTLPNPADSMDIAAQGGLTYITSTAAGRVYAYSTCDQSQTQALTPSAPTLVKALPNGAGAVVADSPAIDVVSTPNSTLNPGCPETTLSTINGYDLGAGNFTAQQILVSTDATHAYIVTSDVPKLLSFNIPMLTASNAALTGSTTAINGGITVDGSKVYLGTNDGTVHQIDTASMTDVAQIAVGLKDGNGNPVVPNLVTVIP